MNVIEEKELWEREIKEEKEKEWVATMKKLQ